MNVNLTAATDINIALFDLDDPYDAQNGKALVQWCSEEDVEAAANCGLLGSLPTEASLEYKAMTITYSGYDGVDGEQGHELIRITGMTTTTLVLKAFTFSVGTAAVAYSWDRGCGGVFSADIPLEAVLEIGEVPAGVEEFKVTLTSSNDVDVQLYDLGSLETFPEGQAIIAYCSNAATCNYGHTATNSTQISGKYRGLTYHYSGWDGVADQGSGVESIQVEGTLNTKLKMTAYGFEAGTATITYSYFQDS